MMEIFKENKVGAEDAFSPENLLTYSIKAKDPKCDHLADCIVGSGAETYFFDSGWLILEHYKEESTLNISNIFLDSNGKVASENVWDSIIEYGKHLGCKKLTMYTKRNPILYERKYGFKVTGYDKKLSRYNLEQAL